MSSPDATALPTLDELRARLGELTLRDEHRLRRKADHARRSGSPEDLRRLARQVEEAAARVERRRAALPAITYPEQLPVSARRDDLLEVLAAHQVVVVAGETGSGKTTQLPKMLLELGRGVRGAIAHTQPRRLAARTVAARIADELDVPLGGAIGYGVRFDEQAGEDTLVRLVTDGLLLAEIQHDRLLRRYDTIIIDEAHERSLNIDFLLGYLKGLLPRRPDLKLVITSATIDPGQFSRHFGDAPVVEVSGRTYPVEVRYRAPAEDDDADLGELVGDAVSELAAEGPGDVLVFLSGEREIRDTADALRGRFGAELDVLPLYARLSTQEQQRVFRPPARGPRRVVLATNVAETSVTVPGIRYVVDPGTARISRYSARLKVQRLPIEPVSQASADQRKGRCGRVAAGIAIRLYDEEDFLERPRFTDPEILRTNLAAVILQMAALDLGPIEDFPFLDPPDRRQVRDGVHLLIELGALEGERERRLTQTGRKLARIPLDPRMARMVLEADRLRCLDEVIVVAAALSIQDPRERPAEHRAHADQLHARFKDDGSDFVAFLNLWNHLREQQRALSGNQFRKRCKSEYLHFLRVREWQDLVGQLRHAAKEVGLKRSPEPAGHDELHQALLSGLLSHVGLRDAARREYQGARGARFGIFPGSALARKPPPWVVVGELVETSRLWGRDAARIDPRWIEPLADHLVKRTYSEPRWDRKRAAVVATERVLLYGLPVVAGRTVPYARIDPELAHDLFLRRALVDRDWDTRHDFFAENGRRLEEVDALEQRARRRDLLVDDQVLYDFFAARVPESVVSGAHFDRWWRDAGREDPDRLTFPRELLLRPGTGDTGGRPDVWRQGDITLPLSYAFAPGTEQDGVTVHVPLTVLPRLRAERFEWLVPALRPELVTALLRTLPKELRRPLVPMPEVAAQVVAALRPRRLGLLEDMAGRLQELRGVRVAPTDFDLGRLAPHLRMTFQIEDEHGAPIAEGQDLEALRAQVRPRLQAELAAATPKLERHGLTTWDIGELPRAVELPGTQGAVRAFPALVDEGATAGVRVLDDAGAQAEAMRAGTRRLLTLALPSPLRAVRDGLDHVAQLALAAAPHGSLGAVVDDAQAAAVDALVEAAGGPAWDAAGFAALHRAVAARQEATTVEAVRLAAQVLGAARDVRRRLEGPVPAPLRPAYDDVAAQLDRLLGPGFIARAGMTGLPDLLRWVRGAAQRLDRLPETVAVDRDRMTGVHELEAARDAQLAALAPGAPVPERLHEAGRLLEELRMSHFAQSLGVRGPVSAKRVRRLLDAR